MKRLLIAMLVVLFAAGAATAEGFLVPNAKPHMTPGTVAVSAGLNVGWGIGAVVGAETILGQINIPNLFPLTYGVAVRGTASVLLLGSFSTFHSAAGVMGTIHFPWTSLVLPEWVQKFDTYAGLGLGVNFTPMGIAFAGISGIAYHFTPSFSVFSEGFNLSGWSFGLQIKL